MTFVPSGELFLSNFFRALGLISFLSLEWIPSGYGLKLGLILLLTLFGSLGFENRSQVEALELPMEFFLGFTQSLPLLLILHTCELFTDLTESARGQTLGSILNPLMQSESSILPVLLRGAFWSLLLQAGILENLISDFFLSLKSSCYDLKIWSRAIITCLHILPVGFAIAVPFCFIILIIEVAAILLARLIPSLSLDSLGFLCRMLACGLGLLILLRSDLFFLLLNLYLEFINGRA